MSRKYNFTTQTFNKNKPEHFLPLVDAIVELDPITPWSEINEDEVYHIPSMLAYERCEFLVREKKTNFLSGMIKEGNKEWKPYSLFKNEARAKFLVKRINKK